MSLQYTLRLLLVCVTLSVVGCFLELSTGDITGNYPKIKIQALEPFKNVDPRIQNPIKSTPQRNVDQFNSRYQWPRFNSDPYSPKTVGNVKNPRFSPTTGKASADVMHYQNKILSSVSSRNNPVELSSVKHDNRLDAKRSYAFQTVQHKPAHFTGSQRSSSENNLAPRLVKKYGLVNGMYAGNAYRSGSFGYQHISKSDHSQPLRFNKPYLRENTAVRVIRPAYAERFESNYTSRSLIANHMRLKSDGSAMFDQNNKVLRRVVPASTSLSIVEPNQQGHKSSPHVFSTETAVISQISYGNTRNPFPSKTFTPSTVSMPSNSNQGHLILPFKKAVMFSSEHDLIQQSDSRSVVSSQANPQSSFEYGKIKLSTSSYTLKDIQLTSAQNDYHNMGQSGQNVAPIQTLPTQRYDNMATGISANMPLMTDDVLSNKRFLYDKNSSIRSQTSSLPDQSMQGMHVNPNKQFPKNTMLFWKRDQSINPPDTTNHSLSPHNTRIGTDLNSSGQSTVQSLFVQNYPVPGNTMKSVYTISPSVSVTYKNPDASRGQNRPYYLTSKKPYAFKGFMFVPTVQRYLQKPEVPHLRKKPLTNSNLRTTQMPLIPDRKEKTLFHFEDIKTSREKQPDRDLTDSFNNRTQLSFKEEVSNMKYDVPKHHVGKGQAVAMSGKNTSNNEVSLRNHLKTGFDEVQSKTSDSNPSEMPTETSSNARFVGSDTHPSTTKSANNHENHKSELVLPIKKSSLINKADGNAVIHSFRRFYYKEQEGPSNPEKEMKDRNSAGVTQSGTRPKSTIVVGKQVEVAEEGNRSRENSSSQNIFSFPGTPIYRSADVKSHKTNSLSTIHRSAVKPFDWGNETKINFSAIGVSQSLSATSSVVVGRLINMFDKVSNKTGLNASSTKTALNNFKPVQFSDIAGSASFAKAETRSAYTGMEVVDVRSFTNRSDSTVMEEMTKSSSVTLKDDVQSPVNITEFEFIPTAATDIGTEENTQPKTTVYSNKPQPDHTLLTEEDSDLINEGRLIPHTTYLVTVTS